MSLHDCEVIRTDGIRSGVGGGQAEEVDEQLIIFAAGALKARSVILAVSGIMNLWLCE